MKKTHFMNKVPVNILKTIYRNQLKEIDSSTINRKTDSTYSHVTRNITGFEDAGLITRVKKGRSKYIELTDEGESLAEALVDLDKAMEEAGLE